MGPGKQWMAALGWTEADCAGPTASVTCLSAHDHRLRGAARHGADAGGLMGHIGTPSITIGVISGALVWLGFVITSITVNNAFQKRTLALTVIDGGHWLAVLVLQGSCSACSGDC